MTAPNSRQSIDGGPGGNCCSLNVACRFFRACEEGLADDDECDNHEFIESKRKKSC